MAEEQEKSTQETDTKTKTKLTSTQAVELRARYLDQAEFYNIFDPVLTCSKNEIPMTVNPVVAPVGCHYRTQHLSELTSKGYSNEDAYNAMAKLEQYATSKNYTVPSDEELIAWAKEKGINILQESNKSNTNSENKKESATSEQIEKAKEQAKPGPGDAIVTVLKNQDNPTQKFDEKDYTEWLCEVYNGLCRAEGQKPQIPTSICVSIALAKTGFINTEIGQFNFWKLPHDDSLTTLVSDEGRASFSSAEAGANACLIVCHRDNFKEALKPLKDKMWETPEEDKQKATKIILDKLDTSTGSALYDKVDEFVKKFNLREWDTDKKVSEGGHADQNTKENSKSGKNGSNMQDKMQKAAARVAALLEKNGSGWEIIPVGADHVRVIKLPRGKTPAEPIYPDFITVGDTVPEWVMSETYAQLKEMAEKKAFEEAGLKLSDSKRERLEAVGKEIEQFKETQFNAWCNSNGVKYDDETSKSEAKEKYEQAMKEKPEDFSDGIWLPDDASKSKYKALMEKKASCAGTSATSEAYKSYQNNLQSVKQEIASREGNWNQDSGHAVYTGNAGRGAAGSSSGSGTGSNRSSNANVEKMVQWALNIAQDDSHGYSQENRLGDPDYDCSSFVYSALKNAGFDVGMGNGDTIGDDLKNCGWEEHDFDNSMVSSLSRGDIMWFNGHVAIYIGDGHTVEATGSWAGEATPGDQHLQDDGEIGQYDVVRSSRPYTKFYHYPEKSSNEKEESKPKEEEKPKEEDKPKEEEKPKEEDKSKEQKQDS